MTANPHRTALRRLLYIAMLGALIFSWLLYHSATAQSFLLVRLYHDQDTSATVTTGDLPASGVAVEVTEADAACTGQVCAASPVAYIVTTDGEGYATLPLVPGVQYNISAPCLGLTVVASEVSGQGVSEMTTCLQGVWLPVVGR